MFNTNNKYFIDKIWKKLLNENNCLTHQSVEEIKKTINEHEDKITMLQKEFNFNINYKIKFLESKTEYDDILTDKKINYIKGNNANKPIGLWFAGGLAWVNHCINPSYGMQGFQGEHIYKFILDKTDVLNISDDDSTISEIENCLINTGYNNKSVDWGPIIGKYKGIYFEDLNRTLKFDHKVGFQDELDVWPTGCIWDLSCIESQSLKKWNFDEKKWEDTKEDTKKSKNKKI